MKINKINTEIIKNDQLKEKQTKDTNVTFKEHLKEAIDNAADTMKSEKINATMVIDSTHSTKSLKTALVKKLEKVISTLELYQNALKNPNIKMSQMENLIHEMSDEKNEIISYRKNLLLDDKLGKLVNETAILILNETNRYYNTMHT